jgi:putative FmdB family regulatory protein
MPFYEYKCIKCGTITEVLRLIKSRDDVTDCIRCGAATERIISRFNTVGPIKAQHPRRIFDTDPACKSRGTAVRLEGGSATFKNCGFQNFSTGISLAKGSRLIMDGNKFENVDKTFEVTDE